MGISNPCIEAVDKALRSINLKYDECSMLELGNQHIRNGVSRYPTGKQHFTALGVKHVSVDLNGKDGALRYDLSRPIMCFDGQFDIVTNFGTSEHVADQGQCFANVHRFCRSGGVMVHAVPREGYYPGHCRFRYTEAFFLELAERNNYRIVDIHEETMGPHRVLILCVMVKL